MTIASNNAMSGPYLGNGVATQFSFTFKIYAADQLQVTVHDNDGTAAVYDVGLDYTVIGSRWDNGGSIILTQPLSAGKQLTITRNMPFTQEMDLENQGAFYAEVIERAVDEGVMRAQQLKEKLDRAVVVPETISPADKETMVNGMVKVAADIDNINIVAGIAGKVTTVAGVAGKVSTVADIAGDVTEVAGIKSHVTAVSGIKNNVTSVANHSSYIVTVANKGGAVSSVASEISSVVEVAGIKSHVTTVAGIAGSVGTVALMGAEVAAVGAIAGDVTTVAGIAGDVTTVANMDISGIAAAGDYAYQWAVKAEDASVDDGVHPVGFSAYHWAQKAAASAASAASAAGFDPDDFVKKTGDNMTGDLMLDENLHVYKNTALYGQVMATSTLSVSGATMLDGGLDVSGQSNFSGNVRVLNDFRVGTATDPARVWKDGDIYGSIWKPWHNSGYAFNAVNARIEARALAIAEARINAMVPGMITAAINTLKGSNPVFTNGLKVQGEIKATNNIRGYTTL